MFEDFFVDRLTSLRNQKNVSAREMSLALGQNESYINRIENRLAFPSMQVFFYICEYFQITPQEFFDEITRAGKDQSDFPRFGNRTLLYAEPPERNTRCRCW